MEIIKQMIQELYNEFTEESIKRFLEIDWASCNRQTPKAFISFVEHSKYLVRKPKEITNKDLVVEIDGLPCLHFNTTEMFQKMEAEGVKLTNEEQNELEAMLVYLLKIANVPYKEVMETLHRINDNKWNLMQTMRESKTLSSKEAKDFIKNLVHEYEELDVI